MIEIKSKVEMWGNQNETKLKMAHHVTTILQILTWSDKYVKSMMKVLKFFGQTKIG